MIGIQRPPSYNINEMDRPGHRHSLNMAAVTRHQKMLKRMKSCPEESEWRAEMDSHSCAHSCRLSHRYPESVQSELLYQRALSIHQHSPAPIPQTENEEREPVTLRRDRKLERTAGFDDTDGPVYVRKRRVERQLGCCARKSTENRLLQQDPSFDLSPPEGRHPLLRSLSDPSLYRSSSIDCIPTGIVQKLKRLLLGENDDDEKHEEYDPIKLHVQNATGHEPFGCELHSFKDSCHNRWFHFLRYKGYIPDDTAARQLGIEENDELLMINKEAVTRVDHRQVELKISRMLKSSNVALLIRRIVEGKQFEYVEIKAEVEVTEELIRVSRTSVLYATPNGRYIVLPNEVVKSKRIKISHQDKVLSWNGDRLVTGMPSGAGSTFTCFTVKAWDTSEWKVVFFYVLKCGEKFVTADHNCVKMETVRNRWNPDNGRPEKVDSRFFRVYEVGQDSSKKIFLECAEEDLKNHYVGCKNGRVELIRATNRLEKRNYTALREEKVG